MDLFHFLPGGNFPCLSISVRTTFCPTVGIFVSIFMSGKIVAKTVSKLRFWQLKTNAKSCFQELWASPDSNKDAIMYSMFGGFGSVLNKKKSFIDNTTFRLHYRYAKFSLRPTADLAFFKMNPLDGLTQQNNRVLDFLGFFQGHFYDFVDGFASDNRVTIHRSTHAMHCQRSSWRTYEHLLLDPWNLHCSGSAYWPYWLSHAAPWSRSNRRSKPGKTLPSISVIAIQQCYHIPDPSDSGRRRDPTCLVSVGLLRALPPGGDVLCASLSMEILGGRKVDHAHPGSGQANSGRSGWKERSTNVRRQLLPQISPDPQRLRVQVCLLRSPEPLEHFDPGYINQSCQCHWHTVTFRFLFRSISWMSFSEDNSRPTAVRCWRSASSRWRNELILCPRCFQEVNKKLKK